jgi:UTP--glucose-1-phosphate uridylyltransferase
VAVEDDTRKLMTVTRMVEKPSPEATPSRMGVAGRYILTPGVFDAIRNQERGAGGEIQLTDGIAKLIATEGVYAYRYDGKRYDCGSKEGFLEATVEFGLKHPDIGPGFHKFLCKLSGMDPA